MRRIEHHRSIAARLRLRVTCLHRRHDVVSVALRRGQRAVYRRLSSFRNDGFPRFDQIARGCARLIHDFFPDRP